MEIEEYKDIMAQMDVVEVLIRANEAREFIAKGQYEDAIAYAMAMGFRMGWNARKKKDGSGFPNNIWHNIEDKQPKKTDKILVLRDGQIVVGENAWLGAFTLERGLISQITSFHDGDKWCYLDDILPMELRNHKEE